MEDAERSFEMHPEAVRILEEGVEEIFEDYERRLREMNSLLVVGDGTTPEQLETNARSVLERAAMVLKGEERSLVAVEEEIYRNIESSDEPLNPIPTSPSGPASPFARRPLRWWSEISSPAPRRRGSPG